jgi:ABC-type multidrug transport system fused ATPase/permease subunit
MSVRWGARTQGLARVLTAVALALSLAVVLLLAVGLAVPAVARARAAPSLQQRLATEYSPILEIRKQTHPPCQTSAEQYQPTSVGVMLGNPKVTLERTLAGRRGLEAIRTGPTAQQVAGLGPNYYLNLPGSPLGDTCVYARDFARLLAQGKAPVITYAHIARETGHSGFALQYWFFWYFNEFNDLHEGDWEGMQLAWESATPEQALSQRPDELIVFQHAGGERAGWDATKVHKEDNHPIVYPAAGSHATFYDSAVYVQNGGHGSGLGCDNTTEPLRELRPRPILLPEFVTETGPFAWLSYYGHWGQKAKGFNNGPTGPQTKGQWREPFTWMNKQRSTSPRMPGGSVVGPQVASAFCGAVATASDVINASQGNPLATALVLIGLAIVIVLIVGFTRWSPIDLKHLRARRAFGQIVRAARQLYGRHWLTMLAIAAIAVPVIGGTQYVIELVSSISRGTQAVGDLLDQLVRPAATAIVSGVVIAFVRSLVTVGRAGFTDSWKGMTQRFWRVVGSSLLATILILLMALTVIGIPFAIWKLVGWAFAQQEVLFEDKSIRESLKASSELVRGRWWRAMRVIVLFYLIGVVTGPILTFALIFTSLPLVVINLIGSLIYALLIPYKALGETLLFFDLQTRAATEPARPRRSWRVWRPRHFGRRVVVPPAPAAGAGA